MSVTDESLMLLARSISAVGDRELLCNRPTEQHGRARRSPDGRLSIIAVTSFSPRLTSASSGTSSPDMTAFGRSLGCWLLLTNVATIPLRLSVGPHAEPDSAGTSSGSVMRRLLAFSILCGTVVTLAVLAPTTSATVWYRADCRFASGACGGAHAHYLSAISDGGSYWTFGHEANPAGYCVHYESGRVPAMNVADDGRALTGYRPPYPAGAYQEGDSARDRVCGAYGANWEHYIAASACNQVGFWCGSVHWTFLPAGDRPWARSAPQALTIRETIEPDNPGSLPPIATVLRGGVVANLFCALLTDLGDGAGAQNLELCYVPWQTSPYPTAAINLEGVGTTPEQTAPNSAMNTPAIRVIAVSEESRYANWLSGSTITGIAPPARTHYAIRITSSQLGNVVRDVNAYLQRSSVGRCGLLNLDYLIDRQCLRLYDQGTEAYQLTALEQDGEGYGFSRWGWSESDLEADG